jgi:hypothetical protein
LSDSANEANCPGCRAAWSQDFLIANLTAAFRTRNFKQHREKVLLDHERARLPETQPDAERYKYAQDAVKPIQENIVKLQAELDNHLARKEYDIIHQKHLENEREYYKLHSKWMRSPEIIKLYNERNIIISHNSHIIRLQRNNPNKLPIPEPREVPPLPETPAELKRYNVMRNENLEKLRKLNKELQPLEKEIETTTALITPYKYTIKHYGLVRDTDAAIKIKHERQFIHKCPAQDCAGFLNTSWECGLCATKACKHCREPVTDPESHVCNPDTVETVKAIAKEAKPCPKCGTLISKISGCDQMWCTQCKTAFSWNTGRIETTVIHNPHYFQWMREAGKDIPRRDVPGDGCNIEHRLDTLFRTSVYGGHWAAGGTDGRIKKTTLYKLSEIEQHRRHHNTVIRRLQANLREYEQDEWRRQLRVQRLVNEITEDEWKIKLQRKEKAYFKERAQLQLIDMYVNVCRDIIAQLLDDASEENQLRIMQQWNELCRFMEDERLKINKAYTCKSPNIFERYPFVIYYQKM